ncbi:hypothetical protein IWQ60_009603 [Tieghemiomyces parasiticus]|uniref:Uncharacterized protein n=1 Tax=Tieghemiomyces parasiticus TaxID=78921 RepID=A0A9W7ZTG9_9FUNG|nr:hypothetical protein IWQ60_009603 [Tieghemiomyces parasiticus]
MTGCTELSPHRKLKVEKIHADIQHLSRSLERWLDLAGQFVNISADFHDCTATMVTEILEFQPETFMEPAQYNYQDKSRQTSDYLAAVKSLRSDHKAVADKLRRNVIEPMTRLNNVINLTPGLKATYSNAENEYTRMMENYCASLSPNADPQVCVEMAHKLYENKRLYYGAMYRYHRVLDQIQKSGYLLILTKIEEWSQIFRTWSYTDHKLLLDCLNFLSKDIMQKATTVERFEEVKSCPDDQLTFDMEEELNEFYTDLGLDDDTGSDSFDDHESAPRTGYLFYYNPHSTESWQRVYYAVESEGDLILSCIKLAQVVELFAQPVTEVAAAPTTFQNRTSVVELTQHGQLNEHEQIRFMAIFGSANYLARSISHRSSIDNGSGSVGRRSEHSLGHNAPKIAPKQQIPNEDMFFPLIAIYQIMETLGRPSLHESLAPTKNELQIGQHDDSASSGSEEFTIEDLKDGIVKIGKLFIRATKSNKNWQILKETMSSGDWKATAATVKGDGSEFSLSLYDNTSCRTLEVIPLDTINRSDIQVDDETLFDKRFCFHIRTQLQGTFYFTADNPTERNVWLCLLKAAAKPEIFGPVQHGIGKPTLEFRAVRTFWVRVVEAHEVSGSAFYCNLFLDDTLRARTSTKTGGPLQWREDFLFTDLPSFYCGVSVAIYSSNKMLKDNLVGQAVIPIPTLRRGETYDGWYPVLGNPQHPDLNACTILRGSGALAAGGGLGVSLVGPGGHGRSNHDGPLPLIHKVGGLRLKLRYDEIVVLPSAEYASLLETLLNYQNHVIFDLAGVARNLEWLSETLLKVFLTKELAIPWFDYLGQHEVARTEDPNILFRGNSVFTKALDAYMKIVGMTYVEDTLGTLVRNICQYQVACEVDPAKLPAGEDVGAQWKILLLYVRILWSSIEQSKARCPVELRVIFSRLRRIIEEKFGTKVDPKSVSPARYTCVSGFFFLRLICPAILSPKLYGLVKENPEPKVHRTLTLLAKSVQCLANLSEFGVKEPHMSPMNEFVMENSSALMEFIDFLASQKDEELPPHATAPSSKLMTLAISHSFHSPLAPYLVDMDKELSALSFFISRFRSDLLRLAQTQQCACDSRVLTQLVRECDDLDKKTRACWTSGYLEIAQYPAVGQVAK